MPEDSSIVKRRPRDERSQSLVDYALALVLFAVIVIISLILLGPSLAEFLEQTINHLSA